MNLSDAVTQFRALAEKDTHLRDLERAAKAGSDAAAILAWANALGRARQDYDPIEELFPRIERRAGAIIDAAVSGLAETWRNMALAIRDRTHHSYLAIGPAGGHRGPPVLSIFFEHPWTHERAKPSFKELVRASTDLARGMNKLSRLKGSGKWKQAADRKAADFVTAEHPLDLAILAQLKKL